MAYDIIMRNWSNYSLKEQTKKLFIAIANELYDMYYYDEYKLTYKAYAFIRYVNNYAKYPDPNMPYKDPSNEFIRKLMKKLISHNHLIFIYSYKYQRNLIFRIILKKLIKKYFLKLNIFVHDYVKIHGKLKIDTPFDTSFAYEYLSDINPRVKFNKYIADKCDEMLFMLYQNVYFVH